jgi:predicted small lipoprotein YifL
MMLAITLAACGKKGALVPPEALVPAPASDLQVRQQGDGFRISWTAPTREERGRPLRDLAGFRLYRHEVLPPGEDCLACPESWVFVRNVDLDYLRDVQRSGDRFSCADRDVKTGTTYRYSLTAVSRRGAAVGRPAFVEPRKKVVAPSPPTLTAVPSPTAVTLEFVATPLAGSDRLGFNVYRQRSGEPTPVAPLTPAPVPGPTFIDRQLDRDVVYRYTVTAVVRFDGEEVESAPSNEVAASLAPPEFR